MDIITEEEINTACKLVLENSKYKYNNIGIIHSEIKNLILGVDEGSVIFKSNKQTTRIKYNLM